ncbi:hypothetical protein [Ilumatobacter sp.]|uniref:hypothetical protein n=1 Tax=Ilumatobacter sp. TaxID=1967498 RepID=UPI003AF69D64
MPKESGQRMVEAMRGARHQALGGGQAPWLRSNGRVGALTNEVLAEVGSGVV